MSEAVSDWPAEGINAADESSCYVLGAMTDDGGGGDSLGVAATVAGAMEKPTNADTD